MTLYYAMGGGLGHLVRARAVAHTLGLEREMVLLTSSDAAGDSRILGPLRVQRVPSTLEVDPEACRNWLQHTLAVLRPETMFVDTFPTGIRGELAGASFPPGMTLQHVARLVRTDALARVFGAAGPVFETTHLVEELTPEHRTLLATRTRSISPLALHDPADGEIDPVCCSIIARHTPFWLVTHSGPADEVEELVRFAAELRSMAAADVDLVVITRASVSALPNRTSCYDLYPATPLFGHARRIVSAAGFNVMRQTAPWRDRHVVLPFHRRTDDQHRRAAREAAKRPGTGV